METAAEPGRREQNKQRTHQALIQAAARLFQENGYEATTVRDIAVAAGVGERTFFRYFPSKESLILQQFRDLVPLILDELRNRPPQEPALIALCNAVLEVSHGDVATILLAGPQPLAADRAVRGERLLLFDLEESLAQVFLERLAVDAADPADPNALLRAAVLARAGAGVLRAIRLTYVRLPDPTRHAVDLGEFVRKAFAVLIESPAPAA
ncbi:AcrR family transcriptional regulator [Kitasatospora sp. MAP12-15]|uniref:TetR family transcriptional regulator n=1 Tax=unclassified Kitasatospora TaxID=2633591 RepID=UPI0024751F7A|nr:TetR family transcriptional regulator [Kitasatospora sp. MAP12-44]MDH6115189.1 AcrR family transcriptional regulator [Kitasatospora sp. MAP12-44]